MPNLNQRSYEAELIDDLSLSSEDLHQNLEELGTINKWLGGNEVTTAGLKQLLKNHRPYKSACLAGQLSKNILRIADIGCGGGDMLKLMASWSDSRGVSGTRRTICLTLATELRNRQARNRPTRIPRRSAESS